MLFALSSIRRFRSVCVGRIRRRLQARRRRRRYPRVIFGENVMINGNLTFTGPGTLRLGDGCRLDGHVRVHTLGQNASVTVEANCYLNDTELVCRTSIHIGTESLLGDCRLLDDDFHGVEPVHRATGKSKPIRVEPRVWLGYRCMILKGVTIGRNSVVGAGTVVRRDVPPDVVIADADYQIIRRLHSAGVGTGRERQCESLRRAAY